MKKTRATRGNARKLAGSKPDYLAEYRAQGRITVLVVDPPWKLKDKLPGGGRGAEKKYRCLSIDKLMSFPLPEFSAPAVLFLWRLAALELEALQLAIAWGFVSKAELRWQKLTTHGKVHFGMGRYTRGDNEVAIIATRGVAFPAVRDQRCTFSAKMPTDDNGRVIHSAKPDAFYSIVERMYPEARYIEMFARRRRPGWEQHGNQLPPLRVVAPLASSSTPRLALADGR